jgi:hypothetical protein
MGGMNFSEYDSESTKLSSMGRMGGDGVFYIGFDFGIVNLEAGAMFSYDVSELWMPSSGNSSYYNEHSAKRSSIHIPLLFKFDIHLGPMVIQPLLGPYLNFALGKLDWDDAYYPYANPPLGFTLGSLLGFTLGRGILFADGRYDMDLGSAVVDRNDWTMGKRSAFVLNFGYQIYLGRNK